MDDDMTLYEQHMVGDKCNMVGWCGMMMLH
jgi:hypothetical protein